MPDNEYNQIPMATETKQDSLLMLLLFVLAFIFLSYAFGKFSGGIILLAIFGISMVSIDSLYKKNNEGAARLVTAASLTGLVALSLYFEYWLAFIAIVLAFIASLTCLKKEGTTFASVFFILFVSLTFSLVIGFGAYFIYAYVIFPFVETVPVMIINLVLLPIFIVMLASCIVIATRLLGTAGMAVSQEEMGGSKVIKLTTIITIIVLVTSVLGMGFVGKSFSDGVYKKIKNQQEIIVKDLRYTTPFANQIFSEQELQSSKIVAKLRLEEEGVLNKENSILRDNKARLSEDTWTKLGRVYSGEIFDDVANNIISTTELSLRVAKIKRSANTISGEYAWLKKNRIDNTPFYDGTQTVQEHQQRLQSTINQLHPRLPRIRDDRYQPLAIMSLGGEAKTLFGKASMKIIKKIDVYKAIEKMSKEIAETKQRFRTESIQEYDTPDPTEGETDSLLRLKVAETMIANEVRSGCETKECRTGIDSLTKIDEFEQEIR